jgi:hypothetical protein
MQRFLTIALLVVASCRSGPLRATDTSSARPTVVRGAFLDENARRAALARGPVPGYAGDMIEGCNYVVLLTDTLRQAAAARKYFGGRAATGCATPGQLLLRPVRYDFAQLYEWYVGPVATVWHVKGITNSSITIQHNRIEIGARPEAIAHVQQVVDSLPIPKDAVEITPGMYACGGTGGPSVLIKVRDKYGRPAASGTTIVIQQDTFKDSVDGRWPMSDLLVGAGNRRPGTYEVRLYKPGYRPIILHDVKAPGDSLCHYAVPSDIREVTLEPLSNAPRVP